MSLSNPHPILQFVPSEEYLKMRLKGNLRSYVVKIAQTTNS